MATIAPWLVPPNFLGAMEAGTAAGERARATDIARSEAADRLRFAYDSLAEKEKQAAALAGQKHELAKAAMELRAQQMQGLQDYRQQQLESKQNELGLRQRLGEANLGLAGQRLELARSKTPNAIHEPGVGIFQINPETGRYDLSTPFPKKATKAILSPSDDDTVKSINRDIEQERKLSMASSKSGDVRRHEGNIDYLTKMKQGILQKANATAAESLQPAASDTKTQTAVPDDFVVVTNPSGKKVRIRKAQLDEALAEGYTQ